MVNFMLYMFYHKKSKKKDSMCHLAVFSTCLTWQVSPVLPSATGPSSDPGTVLYAEDARPCSQERYSLPVTDKLRCPEIGGGRDPRPERVQRR